MVRSESRTDHDFTIIWVPRRSLVSNLVLEEHGVLGEANIVEFPLHFIPLDQDLLSLELEDSFHDLYLRKNPTPIFAAAQALMKLQKQHGLFPRILGKGDNAKRLADLLERMRGEEDADASSDPNNTDLTTFGLTTSAVVENLIIIDREVDFPTVLATQLTYEGLLDEVFGVSNNQTEVDTSVLGSTAGSQRQQPPNGTAPGPTGATKRKVQLDSSDKLFPTIRDVNFAALGPLLNRTARRLANEQESIKQRDQTINDLRANIAKLPVYQAEQTALMVHTSLAEEITKFTGSDMFRRTLEVEQNLLLGSDPGRMHESIEELIARDATLPAVLRLLCLENCLSNGIRQRDLDTFKRYILQAYGYQHILTLSNLEKMGFLTSREAHRGFLNPISGNAGHTATDWNIARRGLQLWVDEVREVDPEDIAYVFSGYAPLSVRLVQCVLQKTYLRSLIRPPRNQLPASGAPVGVSGGGEGSGWKGFEDALSRIRGATVDVVQKGADADASDARKMLRGSKEGPKTTVVFFLGGVTYAEIAALRFVSEQLELATGGKKILIGTTGIISGKRAMEAAIEKRALGV